MYLKNIEIHGFKSFANKINFQFHNGIHSLGSASVGRAASRKFYCNCSPFVNLCSLGNILIGSGDIDVGTVGALGLNVESVLVREPVDVGHAVADEVRDGGLFRDLFFAHVEDDLGMAGDFLPRRRELIGDDAAIADSPVGDALR